MNGKIKTLYLLLGIALVLGGEAKQSSAAPNVVATTNGGGEGLFDDPSNNCFGGTTMFGLGVTIDANGLASGHFECNFDFTNKGGNGGGGMLELTATSGSVGPGTVTFSGPAMFVFANGGKVSLGTLAVTTTAGGPGVGTFCVSPSVCGGTACDHEIVVVGNISIHTR